MVMKQIFLLRVEDAATVQRIIEWYTYRSKTAKQLRNILMERHRQNPSAVVGLRISDLAALAVRLTVEVPELNAAEPITSSFGDSPRHNRSHIVSKLFKRVGKKHK